MASRKKSIINNKNNLLYTLCSQEWYPLIESNQIIINVKKGDIIFKQQEKVEGIYIIETGKVKVSFLSPANKEEKILRLAGNNSILGHRGIAVEQYPITATALGDCKLIFVSNAFFNTLLKTNFNLSSFLINFLADEIRATEERLINFIHLEVKERIASTLLMLVKTFGYDTENSRKLEYTMSRKDFSSYVGSTYETVIRSLFALQKSKFIKLEGKNILIMNEKGLTNLINKKH